MRTRLIRTRIKSKKNAEKLILFMFMFLPLFLISWNIDNDTWFLLNHGRYVWEEGIPYIEPFTIHQEWNFVMQQWLTSLLMWLIYSFAGRIGLIVAVYIVAIVCIILMYMICMEMIQKRELSTLITVFAFVPLGYFFMVTRPQILTYVVLLGEFLLLEKYCTKGKWQWLIPLPILSVLEINFHASMWFLMSAIWVTYLLEKFISVLKKQQSIQKLYPLLIAGLLMLGAGLLNPYGLDAVTYIFTSYGNGSINQFISEMGAPDIRNFEGVLCFGILFVVVFAYIFNKNGKTRLRYVFLTLGTGYLMLSAIRSMALFIIGGVLPLAYWLVNKADKFQFAGKNTRKHKVQMACIFVCLCLGYVASSIVKINEYNSEKDYPTVKNAITFLEKNTQKDDVVLYVDYNNGGYAEFCGFGAYIDPRAEVFLKNNNKQDDVIKEYVELQTGKIHYEDFVKKYNFTHLLITQSDILNVYLQHDENYEIFYKDDKCKIYKRR